jgi:hypothetical protein
MKKLYNLENLIQVAKQQRKIRLLLHGFNYAKSWALNLSTIIKDKNDRTLSHKVNTYLGRNMRDLLEVLVQIEIS